MPITRNKLRLGALKELRKIRRKRLSSDSIIELNKILKIFLDEKFNIPQSLTYQELAKKIKEKRIDKPLKDDIMFISAEINKLEYGSEKEIDKETFNLLLQQAEKIIKGKTD